jgi:hypothetical protein
MSQVRQAYRGLRSVIDPRLTEQTELKITLQAQANDGKLNITAEAAGADPEGVGNLRLRLALAEEEVDFLAPIGIRQHHMVVRAMPGGAAGIGPTDGKFRYNESLDLGQLKQKLADYLNVIESGAKIDFPAKPLTLKPLRLVGFVQNDKTKEILQVVSVPVEGELVYPEIEEKTLPETAPPPPGVEKPASK